MNKGIMISVIISAVTLVSLITMSFILVYQNQTQDQRYKKDLTQMTGNINAANAAAEEVVKKQNATLSGVNTSIKDTQGSITTLQQSTEKSIAGLKDVYLSKADAAKSFTSEHGTFTKLNIGDRTIFINKDNVEIDKGGLAMPGPLDINGSTLYSSDGVLGMKVGNQDVLTLNAKNGAAFPGNLTTAGNLTTNGGLTLGKQGEVSGIFAGDDNLMTFGPDKATSFNGNVTTAGKLTLGKQGEVTGLFVGEDNLMSFGSQKDATFSGPVKTNEILFIPDGEDVYSLIKNAQAKAMQMNIKGGKFDIVGTDAKPSHTFQSDGVAYHTGPLGIGIATPKAEAAMIHVQRDKQPAAIRMQQGTNFIDVGLHESNAYLSAPTNAISITTNKKAATFEQDGTTRVHGSFCMNDQCMDQATLQDMMSKAQRINNYLNNLSFEGQKAALKSNTFCIDGVCLTREQLTQLLSVDQRIATQVATMKNDLSAAKTEMTNQLNTKVTQLQTIANNLGDKQSSMAKTYDQRFTTFDTQLKQAQATDITLKSETDRLQRDLKAQNAEFLRQLEMQKAYFERNFQNVVPNAKSVTESQAAQWEKSFKQQAEDTNAKLQAQNESFIRQMKDQKSLFDSQIKTISDETKKSTQDIKTQTDTVARQLQEQQQAFFATQMKAVTDNAKQTQQALQTQSDAFSKQLNAVADNAKIPDTLNIKRLCVENVCLNGAELQRVKDMPTKIITRQVDFGRWKVQPESTNDYYFVMRDTGAGADARWAFPGARTRTPT